MRNTRRCTTAKNRCQYLQQLKQHKCQVYTSPSHRQREGGGNLPPRWLLKNLTYSQRNATVIFVTLSLNNWASDTSDRRHRHIYFRFFATGL